MTIPDCFLCEPDPKLLVSSHKSIFTMVGFGPLTSRYLIIATKSHIRSFADAVQTSPCTANHLLQTRADLSHADVPLLFTEHGRVPICRDDNDEHEPHCFHAHMLAFELPKTISFNISSYFRTERTFSSLTAALSYSATQEQYFLYSPNSTRYVSYSEPLNVPRQFFRLLVAVEHDQPSYADWRTHPRQNESFAMAERERNLLVPKNETT